MNYAAKEVSYGSVGISTPAAPRECHLTRVNDRITELCSRLSDTHITLMQRADSILGFTPTAVPDGVAKDGLVQKEPPLLARIELGLERLSNIARQMNDVAQRFDQL